jgi:hypothetical protein
MGNQWLPCLLSNVVDVATKILRRRSPRVTRRATSAVSVERSIIWWLMVVLAAVAATSMIGLAPTASAKGFLLPRESCTGPQIAADACENPPQPVPTHMLSPHGSKYRKIAIAVEQAAIGSGPDSSAQSEPDFSAPSHDSSSAPSHHDSSAPSHHDSSAPSHDGS